MALVLRQQCRVNDTPARHGGDEFIVVLPDADAESARTLAQRVGAQLARDREQPPLSFSYGVASLPKDGSTFEQVMEKADRALYEMKRSGLRKAATSRD